MDILGLVIDLCPRDPFVLEKHIILIFVYLEYGFVDDRITRIEVDGRQGIPFEIFCHAIKRLLAFFTSFR